MGRPFLYCALATLAVSVAGCASTSSSDDAAFHPQADGVVILFSKACVDLYPRNDGSLEAWLDRPGIVKLDQQERPPGSTKSSVEYAVQSVALYSLVYEKINLCTVRAQGIDRDAMKSSLAQFRSGVVKSGLDESIKRSSSRQREHAVFEYRKNGEFVLRIDLSLSKREGVAISAVSNRRSVNL